MWKIIVCPIKEHCILALRVSHSHFSHLSYRQLVCEWNVLNHLIKNGKFSTPKTIFRKSFIKNFLARDYAMHNQNGFSLGLYDVSNFLIIWRMEKWGLLWSHYINECKMK